MIKWFHYGPKSEQVRKMELGNAGEKNKKKKTFVWTFFHIPTKGTILIWAFAIFLPIRTKILGLSLKHNFFFSFFFSMERPHSGVHPQKKYQLTILYWALWASTTLQGRGSAQQAASWCAGCTWCTSYLRPRYLGNTPKARWRLFYNGDKAASTTGSDVLKFFDYPGV